MKNVNDKVIEYLYKTYGFIEEDISKFSKIVLAGINKDDEYKEALVKGKRNIVKYINKEIKKQGFLKLFTKAVEKIGPEKSYSLYDMIISEMEIDIEPDDIMSLALNEKYKSFYDEIKTTRNVLLKNVLEAYRPDEEEIDDTPEMFNGRITDTHEYDYMSYIKNIPILNREEEQALLKKYRETADEDEKKEIKEEFISHYLRLAAKEAINFRKLYSESKLSLMDSIQEGNRGLVLAFDKFDERLGFRFTTYSRWWIQQSIKRGYKNENDTIRIPVHMGEIIDKKNSFIHNYINEYNREPSEEEVMQYLNLNKNQYNELIKAEDIRKPLSLDYKVEYEDTKESRQKTIEVFIADESTDIENDSINEYTRDEMISFMTKYLKKKEIQVVKNVLGFNKINEAKTFEATGKIMGITRERVRQLYEQAIDKLQSHMDEIETPEHKYHGQILSKLDLKRKLGAKAMDIKVVQYTTKEKVPLFACNTCGKEFYMDAEKLLELGDCPYCKEKEKKLVK